MTIEATGDKNMARFSNTEFEFSHGKAPRGTGQWAFRFDRDQTAWFAAPNQSFSQAKREAAAEAKRRGAAEVFTQP